MRSLCRRQAFPNLYPNTREKAMANSIENHYHKQANRSLFINKKKITTTCVLGACAKMPNKNNSTCCKKLRKGNKIHELCDLESKKINNFVG